MTHDYTEVTRPKMDASDLVAGSCSCGYMTSPGTPLWAFKTWEQHVRDVERGKEPVIEPFNWHEADRDSFMHWAVVAMISDRRGGNSALNRVMQASDNAKALKIVIEINGVRLTGVPFFERLWDEMQRQAEIHAASMVDDELAKLVNTRVSVERIMNTAAEDVRRRFKELGLPMEDNHEW